MFDIRIGAALFAGVVLASCGSANTTPARGTAPGAAAAAGTIYSFNWTNGPSPSPANDGQQPKGTLVLVGSTLYGRTAAGGFQHNSDGGCGTVFSINPSGTNYQVLYRFNQAGNGADGCDPRHDAPVVFGGNLYATNQGVSNSGVAYGTGAGVIFSILANPSPSSVTVVHAFQGAPNDGGQQHSSFSIDPSGLFYGQTAKGGANDHGEIYSLNGTTYQRLYDFSTTGAEGEEPHGRIVLVNGVLYGVSRQGPGTGGGTIFSLATPAPGVAPSAAPVVLHALTGGPNDGYFTDHGYVTPTVDANGNVILYGMTTCGGGTATPTAGTCNDGDPTAGYGVIYQVTLAAGVTSRFSLVYAFKGGADGANPYGSLTLDPSGKTLYGTTSGGGSDSKGTVFSIPVTAFGVAATPTTLWNFLGANHSNGGEKPIDNVILVPTQSGTMLCGMTVYGGNPNPAADLSGKAGDGTVFCVPTTPTAS